ncbi:hypothetical protein [Mucilaginibacter ginkgonis]|uniref:Uncharacterized protein n=1 Tax=Mucilaginibacter ginkgonis TaxID=2682091 RepID=A0A6I4I0V2_9SPHI|nr:hypothetical protein [Mucilaginibacter ginkgonis]QQL49761.1 hypothetical protein GO620_016575 [Mucilaginibacter ginkgonis]
MKHLGASLQTRVHSWIENVGFRLNRTDVDKKRDTTTRHYFFETFNFIEKQNNKTPDKARFLAFDTYGEKLKVRSLLDLQSAFYENLSQLK